MIKDWDLFVLNGNPMIVKRIYSDGTDAAFVEDRIGLQLNKPKSKQL